MSETHSKHLSFVQLPFGLLQGYSLQFTRITRIFRLFGANCADFCERKPEKDSVEFLQPGGQCWKGGGGHFLLPESKGV